MFNENGRPARLTYQVVCDGAWRTQQGEVRGWLADRSVAFTIVRSVAGVWTLNGAVVEGLASCVDLDLAFTPATNLLQLRRAALAEGEGADVPVAWLDPSAGTLELLAQRYERRTDTNYWYESPRFGYAAMLDVGPDGFVRRYPGLWEAED